MKTENRKKNIELELSRLVAVVPAEEDDEGWGWAFTPSGDPRDAERLTHGWYPNKREAMEAGIGYLYNNRLDLRHQAEREAVKGEKYRARQRRLNEQ